MSNLYKIAKTESAILEMIYDEDCTSPREWSNLGHMICWHNRYDLGDEHNYSEPSDFLQELASELLGYDDVDWIKEKADIEMSHFRIEECKDEEYKGQYEIIELDIDGEDSYDGYAYDKKDAEQELQNIREKYIDKIYEEMSNKELMELIQTKSVILPLYLYDHSGITMNTGGFSCPWDSGQVGWIYITHDEIEKEYGNTNKETLEKVEKYLEGEVETYDQYLRGDVYGFKLYEVDKEKMEIFKENYGIESIKDIKNDALDYVADEIDSCWGFYGDDAKENGILDNIGKEYEYLVNELEYV